MDCASSIEVWGYTINEPSVIPTCILAAIVGYLGFISLSRHSNVRGAMVYSYSFFMFGTMMSDAMFVHSFFDEKSIAGQITGLIDVGLTSSVGLSFLYNGLVDLNIISERSVLSIVVMLLSYIALFGAWLYSFATHWQNAFLYLYFGVILFGCGSYCLLEVIYIIKSGNWKGTAWLFAGGMSGAVGVLCVFKWNKFFCDELSPYLSGDFWWFLLSDVSMYCLYRFFLRNKASESSLIHPAPSQLVINDDIALLLEESDVEMRPRFYPVDGVKMQAFQLVPLNIDTDD